MKADLTRCKTCGSKLDGSASLLGTLCSACVLRASWTPGLAGDDEETSWADVFPQLEVERTLDDADGLAIYLARVVVGEPSSKAVLQVVSGPRLIQAGGGATLVQRADRLSKERIAGLARVLDFGDLGDAFFLVTEAPDFPLLADMLSSSANSSGLLSSFERARARLLTETADRGSDPNPGALAAFYDSETEQMVLTPSALPGLIGSRERSEPVLPFGKGHQVGPFVLEEVLGEGGFGEVWRARQDQPVRRRVALKILKHGLQTARARARFDLEQQALARLEHPHIARLIAGGTTPDGRPYFAMEWIEGQSITRFCRDHRLSLPDRLRLFAEVCEAVQFAHQKGVIHRDLKAANVMVTTAVDEPAAKVIDFGIARASTDEESERTLMTRHEELLGTPATMSPEQAAGNASGEFDARSDVYGLGVLLFELLADELPFDSTLSREELLRRVREDDPPKPSQRGEFRGGGASPRWRSRLDRAALSGEGARAALRERGSTTEGPPSLPAR